MLRWSDGDGQIVEGDAEPVASLDVGGDVTVAAAQILHKYVTGGEDPLTGVHAIGQCNSAGQSVAGAGTVML